VNDSIYDGFMQHLFDKNKELKIRVGKVIQRIRKNSGVTSLNKFALEYDIDRGNLSKIERGEVGCSINTAWRIIEAAGVRFSDFARMLEEDLGEDFKLMDE